MILHAVAVVAALAATGSPPQQDPLGPLLDVTAHWRHYQPASTFCVKPDVNEYAQGGVGATATGADPACARSGFPADATGLVKIHVRTPRLCAGCRRLFMDFSKIPAANAPPAYYAHGHAYYRLVSANPAYTIDPVAHSPNTKNFTNDKLVAPDGSPQEQLVAALDLHDVGYTTDTAHFVHTAAQGPYYIGPWYLSRGGRRIEGAYLDVDVAGAPQLPGGAQANAIAYMAGFDSGQACPSDDDAYYGGCVDASGGSAETVDPFAA
jgi:hypothetical protein